MSRPESESPSFGMMDANDYDDDEDDNDDDNDYAIHDDFVDDDDAVNPSGGRWRDAV